MENAIKISVIMPAYQAEKTIERAIKSVLNQSFCEWELIIVDDCSTDFTYDIIEHYMKIDKRVRCIDLNCNKGPSNARNIGIQRAQGKYIAFLDADDWIEQRTFDEAFTAAEKNKAEVVVWGIQQDKVVKNSIIASTRLSSSLHGLIQEGKICEKIVQLDKEKIFSYVWNKLYLKKNIENVFFEDINLSEDFLFNLSVFENCNTVVILTEPLYHYTQSESITLSNDYKPHYFEIMKLCQQKMLQLCRNKNFNKDVENEIYNIQNKIWISTMMRYWSRENKVRISEKVDMIEVVLNDELVRISSRKARPENRKDAIFKMILCIKSKYIVSLITCVIYIFYRNVPEIFYKIK